MEYTPFAPSVGEAQKPPPAERSATKNRRGGKTSGKAKSGAEARAEATRPLLKDGAFLQLGAQFCGGTAVGQAKRARATRAVRPRDDDEGAKAKSPSGAF